MQTAQIPAGNSERPVYIFPENQILMFLWRIDNQEQARTVADHFAFSVDSSCIIISGKKDNLERLTEILKRISEYVLFHSTLKRISGNFGRMERALHFLKTE